MPINIYADFEGDYKKFILLSIEKYFNIDLDNKNYAYLKTLQPQELYFRYIADSKRIPPARCRKVHVSKELLFSDEYKIFRDKIENIINIFKTGKTIRPYLNKDVKHIFKKNCPKDFLLNDWDLYHLHLGDLQSNANFCDRTKYVLFCKITETDVYLVHILDHTEDSSFACEKLLTIIRDNWIEQYNVHKLHEISRLEKDYSDSEYRHLRENGVCSLLNIDGEYFISPNLGVASSGDSSKDVQITMQHFHALRTLQKHILNSAKMIYDFIIRCDIRHKKPYKIHLKLKHIDNNILIAQDIYSKAIVELKMNQNYVADMVIKINQHRYTIQYVSNESINL